MIEYLKLLRFNNLTGVWLLFLPCLWVILLLIKNTYQLAWIPIFLFGSIIMRSAGCIINDMADMRFDSKVERTKNRPLAIGSLKRSDAMILLFSLLLVAFFLLLFIALINQNSMKLIFLLGFLMFFLIILYPFSKRFFKYPQILLAIIFNSGAFFASIAVSGYITITSIFIYLGSFFWILYYDTIYGHQDKKYDKELGLNSMSLTEMGTKKWLRKYYKAALSFWLFAGVVANLNFLYYISIAGLFYLFYRQMQNINLDKPSDCMDAFKFNCNIGLLLSLAIIIGKI